MNVEYWPELSLRSKVFKGSLWAFLEKFIPQIITIFVIPFLARILSPKDFGLLALAGVCVGFFDLFYDYGFGSAIIQKKDLEEKDIRTAFSFSCVVGISLFFLTLFLSKPISIFFDEPQIRPIIRVLSVSFLLKPLTGIQNVLLQKQMQFHALAIARIAGVISYVIISLTMALKGFGVWSIVFGLLADQGIKIPVLYYYSRWPYHPGYSKETLKDFFHYGIYLFLFRIIDYASMQLDKIIIGRGLGSNMLGYYSMANNMSKKLFHLLGIPLGKVLFPAFSSIQKDNQRLRDGIIEVYNYVAIIVFPLSMGLSAIAPELVHIFLGPKWGQSVILLQILAIAGGPMVIGGLIGAPFLAKGRTDIHFKLGLFNSVVRITSILIGSFWGAVGIAMGLCVTSLGIMFWNPYVMCRTIDLRYRILLNAIFQPIMISIFMAIGILFLGEFMQMENSFTGNLAGLSLKTFLGITIFFSLNRLFGVRLEVLAMTIIKQLDLRRSPEEV